MNPVATLDLTGWSGPFPDAQRDEAVDALEQGKVLFFPDLAFHLEPAEQALLKADLSNGKAKNISLTPQGELKGLAPGAENVELLRSMVTRFSRQARDLLLGLAPGYEDGITPGRTTYRPVEIAGREYSPRKDDRRMHVDAFPSKPTQGRRILRVFSNVHPDGGKRQWRIGEPFEDMAKTIAPRVRNPLPFEAGALSLLGITRSYRTPYDHLMLGLHDGAKLDAAYQAACPRTEFAFPAGSTWIVYTDQVMHAALAGQFALEQTFHLNIEAMARPERAPLSVLEQMMGRPLI